MEGIRIDTAQNVVLHYELASFGDRMVAFLVDLLVLVAWWIVVAFITSLGDINSGGVFFVLVFVPFFFYHLFCELLMNGQSVGKRTAKVRVVRLDGRQATIGQYMLRWLLRPVDSLYFIGVIVILLNGKGQRLGDIVAGTTLVSVKARRSLAETLVVTAPDNHVVRYANAHLLSDAQAQLMKDVLSRSAGPNGHRVIAELAAKVRQVIGADGQEADRDFLKSVLRDHTWLTSR
ncbi:MAG: RDD family protein [Flavobacteriales bacterium]|nr:RDD family protein [Flavobacteriales bacterium]MBL0045627.1 RDD family protein [Flavobacteriales bacterium]